MINYLAVLMTIAGVAGFCLSGLEHPQDKDAGALALKIASALLAAIVTLYVKGA
jgi:hypothetical protein